MGQLDFDERTSKRLEAVYRTRDVLRRRALVRDALGARPGERILDIGCGPGFYLAELLDEVGSEGGVVGVDSSPAMLAIAAERCAGHDNVELHEADATSLPVAEASFDAALSVQVLEYVATIPRALAELHRVLKPGGRVVLWDVDWATMSLRTSDPARMERVIAAWDEHLSDPSLPRSLTAALRDAGFDELGIVGHPFVTNELVPDTYGGFVVPFLEQFVSERDPDLAATAKAWADEQRGLAERGEFYFAVIQFCFTAVRPS